jgi:hypothetical protein
MKRCLTAMLFVLLTACVGAAQTARIGREFKFKVGRVVTLDGGNLRVRFVGVASDSRCPVDVNCIWAGNADVQFEVSTKGRRGWQEKRTLNLNTNASTERPGEEKYRRYTIKLVGLNPQPRSKRKIPAGQYTATLLVVKE